MERTDSTKLSSEHTHPHTNDNAHEMLYIVHFIYYCVWMYVCVHTCEGRSTILGVGSLLHMWIPDHELRFPGVAAGTL